ncbi:hypothetical protein ABKN59_001412 [Abortiporus biennis]
MSGSQGPAGPRNASSNASSRIPNPPPVPEYRSKVVEILSATANNALSELGYFPGIVQKVQMLQVEIQRLKEDNNRIFQDNREIIRWNQELQQHNAILRDGYFRMGMEPPALPPSAVPREVPNGRLQPNNRHMSQPIHSSSSQPIRTVDMTHLQQQPRRTSLPLIQTGQFYTPPVSDPSLMTYRALPTGPALPSPSVNVPPSRMSAPARTVGTPYEQELPMSRRLQSHITSKPSEVIDLTSLDEESPTQEAPRKKARTDSGISRSEDPSLFPPIAVLPEADAAHVGLPVQATDSVQSAHTATPPPISREPSPVSEKDNGAMDVDEASLLIEACIDAAFYDDPDDENKIWCMMCKSLHESKILSDAPPLQPFDRSDQAKIVEHCETVHPAGWATLKGAVDLSAQV